MTPILKDPGAVMRYTIAWPPGVLAGATIVEAVWTVEPVEDGGIAVDAHFIEGGDTGVALSGGAPGRVYRVACHAVLSDGREDARSVVLRVEDR